MGVQQPSSESSRTAKATVFRLLLCTFLIITFFLLLVYFDEGGNDLLRLSHCWHANCLAYISSLVGSKVLGSKELGKVLGKAYSKALEGMDVDSKDRDHSSSCSA